MPNQLQITLRDMSPSNALEARIRRALQRLERLYSGIMGCRVVVEAPHHRQREGRQFVVRLDLAVPGDEIVVNRDHHEDLYVALRDAFDAARRQLDRRARRQRGQVKAYRRSGTERA